MATVGWTAPGLNENANWVQISGLTVIDPTGNLRLDQILGRLSEGNLRSTAQAAPALGDAVAVDDGA